jgi:hypothetical protein
LDQLERRYCKDTPLRPFYIGVPKGPILRGLIIELPTCEEQILLTEFEFHSFMFNSGDPDVFEHAAFLYIQRAFLSPVV